MKKTFSIYRMHLLMLDKGDLKKVHKMIQQGCIDINGQNEYSRTALYYACDRAIINALMQAGTDIAGLTTTSETTKDYLSIASAVNIKKSPHGETALHAVMCDPYYTGSEVEALLKTNININVQNKDGKTALHLAVERQGMDVIELLLDKNVNALIQDNQRCTAFLTAIAMRKRPQQLICLFE